MCGFFLVFGECITKFSPAALYNLSDHFIHRGPDGEGAGYFSVDRFLHHSYDRQRLLNQIPENVRGAWIHRRLSFQDLSNNGLQPLFDKEMSCGVVFNGEIYNFKDLKTELESKGHLFRSNSDTEVLLYGWKEWGEEVLKKLRGMFSFVIVDQSSKELVFARDQFGIKPLYFSATNNSIYIGSEIPIIIDALRQSREKVRLSQRAIGEFFRKKGETDNSVYTLTEGIFNLPPGSCVRIKFSDVKRSSQQLVRQIFGGIKKFWSFPSRQSELTAKEAADLLRNNFIDSVRHHIISDRPVVSTLSGGIDSSALVGALRYILGDKETITSFGVTIPTSNALNEAAYMRSVALKHSIDLVECPFGDHDLISLQKDVSRFQGEPFIGLGVIAQNFLFKIISEHGYKAVLGGQGADEQLGGYGSFLALQISKLCRSNQWDSIENILEHTENGINSPYPAMPIRIKSELNLFAKKSKQEDALNQLFELHPKLKTFSDSAPEAQSPYHTPMAQFLSFNANNDGEFDDVFDNRTSDSGDLVLNHQYLRFNKGLQKLLRYEDRNAMQYSIENRVPFLDKSFTEAAYSLPVSALIDEEGTTKFAFRDAFADFLPPEILERKKKLGFSIPTTWFSAIKKQVQGYRDYDFSKWDCIDEPHTLSSAMMHADELNGLSLSDGWLVLQLAEYEERISV